jgi:hypothetical protein
VGPEALAAPAPAPVEAPVADRAERRLTWATYSAA